MVGGGGNGKGVLLLMLIKLLGKENVSNAYIERLDDKGVRAGLEGKLVNISPEMGINATMADGYLKSITSGDTIEAERKYQPSFSFKPYVRLIAATNRLPRLLDLTNGFFRRAIVLSFNQTFLDEKKDPELEAKLTVELPGILTWAVEGLRELRAAGKFVIPSSSDEALQQYKAESDPVGIFCTECLAKVDTGDGLQPATIYAGYRNWSIKSGYKPVHKGNFGKQLSERGFIKKRSGGKDYWLAQAIEGNGFIWDSEMTFSPTVTPVDSNVVSWAKKYVI